MVKKVLGILSLFACQTLAQFGGGNLFPSGYGEMYDYNSTGTTVTLSGENLFLPSSMDHGYQYPYVSVNSSGGWTFPEHDTTNSQNVLSDIFEDYAGFNETRFDSIMNYVLQNILEDGVYDAPSNLNASNPLLPYPMIFHIADAIANDFGCAESWEEMQELYSDYDEEDPSQCEVLYVGMSVCMRAHGYNWTQDSNGVWSIQYVNCFPFVEYDPEWDSFFVHCNCEVIYIDDLAVTVDPTHPVDTTASVFINSFSQNTLTPIDDEPYIQIIKRFEREFMASVHAMWVDVNDGTTPQDTVDDYNDRISSSRTGVKS